MNGRGASWRRCWPVLALLAVAAAARFAAPERYPPGFAQHAVVHNEMAIDFLEAIDARWAGVDVAYPDITQQFGLMSALQALAFLVLGVGFRQAMVLAALFGVLAVAVAYLAGREIAGHRAGLASAVLLAGSSWHLAFSRYGDPEHSLPVLQFLLVLWLAFVAVRRRSAPLALLLGLVAGLSWYVYGTNQLVPLLLLLWMPLLVRRFGRPGWAWAVAAVAGCAATSWLAVARSLEIGSVYPVRAGLRLGGRYEVLGAREALEQVPQALAQLFVEATDAWFARPGGVFPIVGTLLLVGGVALLAGAVRRGADRPTALLLLGSLALAFVPGLASWGTGVRRLLLVPTVGLFVQAWCVTWLLERPEVARVHGRWRPLLGAAAGIAWLAWGVTDYVWRVGQNESAWHESDTQVARYVAGQLGRGHLAVLGADATDADVTASFVRFAGYEALRRARRSDGPPAPPFSAVDVSTYGSLAAVCAALPAGAAERRRLIAPTELVERFRYQAGNGSVGTVIGEFAQRGRQRQRFVWEATCPGETGRSGGPP
jgi:hypothetical protein